MVELISIKSQSFSVDGVQSTSIGVDYNVPQGSVLGSLEFIFYTEDVVEVFTCNLVRHHLFADDKQLYWSGNISNIIRHQLCCCVTVIRDWCSSRRLQLNALKTELQWFGSRATFASCRLPTWNDVIQLVTVVRDLGVYLDNEPTMKQHISRVVSSCFSWGNCVKSVALLVKMSSIVWSRHSCSADSTIVTLYSQAFPSRPSDRCSVYRTQLLISSLKPSQEISFII